MKKLTILGGVPLPLELRHHLLDVFVPHEERQIGISAFIPNEPPTLRFRQDAIQYANNALNLVIEALLCGW